MNLKPNPIFLGCFIDFEGDMEHALIKWLGCWLLVCWALSVDAQTTETTVLSEGSNVTLTIKPHICIAPRGETS